MNKTKKIISLLLSLIMILSIFNIVPFTAGAVEAEAAVTGAKSGTTGDCTWTLDNGVLTISGNGKMGVYFFGSYAPWFDYSFNTVVIESGVTSIGHNAFYRCTQLTSVTIPDSVTSIGAYAFKDCTGLKSVTIPDSVTSIGGEAFYNCTKLKEVHISDIDAWCKNGFQYSSSNPLSYAHNLYLNDTLITELVIPDSVTSIGGFAFSGCTGLTSVTIPDSVTSIGEQAFRDCTGLKSVTIPDSVTSIGDDAFSGCKGLTSITIPDSVTSIGDGAFSGTAWYNNQPNGLVYAGKVAYGMKGTCPSEVVIKDGTLGIADYAFSRCTGLTSVTIPDSVTSIAWGAFWGCSNLTSVTIPDSVTSIGGFAFSGCTSLTSIDIPDSVTSIGQDAFYNCTSLTSIDIPDSVTSIGDYAFYNCSNAASIYIGNSVVEIGYGAFGYCKNITSITIPDSTIGINLPPIYSPPIYQSFATEPATEPNAYGGTFSSCSSLETATIGNSVTSIGDYAFFDCTSLKSVTIPDSVTSIGYGAFYNCTSLTSVTIPDSVTSIGSYAFGYYKNKEYYSDNHNYKMDSLVIYGYEDTEAEKYAKSNGFSFKLPIGKCEHCNTPITDADFDVKFDATCTEDGAAYWHCGKCGELGESVLPALGHDYKAVVTHPTCTKDGYTTHTCSRCKDSYKDNQVKALGHDYHTVVTPPTCTKDGCTTHTCSRCKDTYVTDQVKALGHDYHQVSVTPPTCTEDGYTTYTCSRCNGTKKDDKVTALGHVYLKSSVTPPTCTEGGYTTYICSRCGASKTDDILDALGHNFDVIVKRHPTATQPGIMTAECKRCSEKKNVVLPVLSENDYTLTKSAEVGKATYTMKDKTYSVYKTVADAPEGWYASGTTGDCTWVKEGTALTISVTDPSVNSFDKGTANYNNTSPAPWKDSDITDVIINEGVTRIGSYAFCECKKLKRVSISDTVTTIGFSAFYDCTSLTDVKMPNSLWYTGDSVFNGCTSLKNITIPNSISKIESFTFARSGLTNITIPESVYSIQDYAFNSCHDLKSVTILNPGLVVYKDQTNFSGTQKALGWYIDDYGDDKKIPDFTIYGYKGSNVEKFANNNSFKFIGLDQKTDSATGISVVIPESHNIRVKELTEKNGISAVNDMLYGCKATKAYDIEVTKTIYVVSPDNPSQLVVDKPGNNMQIKIPCADKTATVYRKEKDGGFTKINAIYEKGYMVIYTDRAGTFALTVPCKTALGDVDGNEAVDVKDATWIQRLVAGIEIPFTVADMYADIDGDGEVTIMDATAIQRYAIRIPVPYPIGQTI